MRIIVHCDNPLELVVAMTAVRESINHDYNSCGYTFNGRSVFVYRNKTGWTVHVYAEPKP